MMNWLLGKKLTRMGRRAVPTAAFDKSLRVTLEAAGFLPHRSSLRLWIFRHVVAIGSAATMMTVGVTGAYAYASDDVLPDHPLYPVREAIEQLEYRMPVPVGQLKQRLKNHASARRVKEIRKLINKKIPLRPKHVRYLEKHPEVKAMIEKEREDNQEKILPKRKD